jgi:transglutaminase-like putative cysteine protease
MQIRIGYELVYDCPQPTPMLLMLSVHQTRAADLVTQDGMAADPPIAVHSYRDGFGNSCTRITAPAGRVRLYAGAVVNDTGQPDAVPRLARQHPVEELPDDTLAFLLPTRYCETDRLLETAWSLFGATPLGWSRVEAILDYVHRHIAFGYERSADA